METLRSSSQAANESNFDFSKQNEVPKSSNWVPYNRTVCISPSGCKMSVHRDPDNFKALVGAPVCSFVGR